MYIAQRKRKENIAEYILYLWQLEDLLRALQFSPEAIYSQLVQKSELDEAKKQEVFFWYMDLVNLLRKEGKEENGHLEHTLHLIDDLETAKQLVRSACLRGYGAARIRQELSRRGISREDADAAMELFSPALPQMLSLLEKRLHGDLSDRKEVDKAVAALQRRGFSWSDIKNALEEYGASLDIDE